MIQRYQTETMNRIFGDENKFRTWYVVELAYFEALCANDPCFNQNLCLHLKERAAFIDWQKFAASVGAREQQNHHDVIAFLDTLEDNLGEDARLLHFGLTSSDIVDTAQALLAKEACGELLKKLALLVETIFRRANDAKGVLCLGRTHGQAAEPTTFGIKLLSHMAEMARASIRLRRALATISVGKFSGAVGVYAHTDPEVEERALYQLGLTPETAATQVIARDRYAELFTCLAILGGSIERLAIEIRLLMHGQIGEVFEPFAAQQKGSSAMPHKKNPILSENLTGLMRLIRSYAPAALENQALWHERDISHSSVERVIMPDAFHIMDFALTRLTKLMDGLSIDKKRMQRNLKEKIETLASQSVLLALIKKGLSRSRAYEMVQQASLCENQKSFKENLHDAGVGGYLNDEELSACFDNTLAIKHENSLFARAKKLKDQLNFTDK